MTGEPTPPPAASCAQHARALSRRCVAGVQFKSIAVLYRTHAVGRGVYQALKERRIPCAASSADVAPVETFAASSGTLGDGRAVIHVARWCNGIGGSSGWPCSQW